MFFLHFRRFVFASLVAFSSLCFGVSLAWILSNYKHIIISSGLGYPVDEEKLKWMTTIYVASVGAMFFPAALLVYYIGAKLTMIASNVAAIIGWPLLIFGNHFYYAYCALSLIGVSAGGLLTASYLYIMEISTVKKRGSMCLLNPIFSTAGLLYGYSLTAFCRSLFLINCLASAPFLVNIFLLIAIPETPDFYIIKLNRIKAERSLRILKPPKTHHEVEREVYNIIVDMITLKRKKVVLRGTQFFVCPLCKSLAISFMLQVLHQLAGVEAYTFFLSNNFIKSTHKLFHINTMYVINTSCILLILILLSLVIDRANRLLLLTLSSSLLLIIGTIFAFICLQTHSSSSSAIMQWTAILLLLLYNCLFYIGLGALSTLLCMEMFENNLRHLGLAFSLTVGWLLRFVIFTFCVALKPHFVVSAWLLLFLLFNSLAIVYQLLYVPETKGKTYNEIQSDLQS